MIPRKKKTIEPRAWNNCLPSSPAVGAGGFGSVEEACTQSIRLTNQTRPITENVKRYAEYYDVYRSLYGALKPSFDTVTRLAAQQ